MPVHQMPRPINGGQAWWASADGRTWEPLELPGYGTVVPGDGLDHGAVGDTAFFVPHDDGRRRDLWVVSFDTVPAVP